MWLWSYFLISLFGLILASYTDLSKRIIPNSLTYTLIATGLALHALQAFFEADALIFAIAAVVTVLAFLGSYALWKAGVWAGGDVKMMTAIAALNPINYAVLRDAFSFGGIPLFSSLQIPLFPLTLFLCSIFAMFPYGAAISVHGISKDKKLRTEFFADAKKSVLHIFELSLLVAGLDAILASLGLNSLLALPLLVVIAIIGKRALPLIAVAAFAYAAVACQQRALWELAAVFLPLLALYVLIKLYTISKDKVLKKEVRISELKEGMISAETIVERDGKIERVSGLGIGKIIKHLKDNNLQAVMAMLRPKGEVIAGRSAAGLEKEEIEKLKDAAGKGLIEDNIMISISAPFVPAILIAYVALQAVGDLIWNILF